MASAMKVPGFQEEVFGLVIAVPAYTVVKEDAGGLSKVRENVPAEAVPEDKADDMPLVKLGSLAWGKRFVPLTPTIAKRLEGRTVPALTGQAWMDHVSGGRANRQKAIALITIHGIFDAPKQKGALVVSELEAKGKLLRRFTYGAYVWQGFYGTGSGHDPILVYVGR